MFLNGFLSKPTFYFPPRYEKNGFVHEDQVWFHCCVVAAVVLSRGSVDAAIYALDCFYACGVGYNCVGATL